MNEEQQELQIPQYRCHKVVGALKIAEVEESDEKEWGSKTLHFEETQYPPMLMTPDYVAKHDPKPGGYYVVYDGGYESWSPADVFEDGYTRLPE